MKEYLDDCIEKYFQSFLRSYKFEKFNESSYNVGASYDFKNEELKLKIINDRGIVEIAISSIFSEIYYGIEHINIMLKKDSASSNSKSSFGNSFQRLGFEAIRDLVEENYEVIAFYFNQTNYESSEIKLQQIRII